MEISFVNKDHIFTVKPKTFRCDHPNVEIDMDYRSVKCIKCGCNIDPFEFILKMAETETRYENRIKDLAKEIKRTEAIKSEIFKRQ